MSSSSCSELWDPVNNCRLSFSSVLTSHLEAPFEPPRTEHTTGGNCGRGNKDEGVFSLKSLNQGSGGKRIPKERKGLYPMKKSNRSGKRHREMEPSVGYWLEPAVQRSALKTLQTGVWYCKGSWWERSLSRCSLPWHLLECLVGCIPFLFRRHGCRGHIVTWYLVIIEWPAHIHLERVLENSPRTNTTALPLSLSVSNFSSSRWFHTRANASFFRKTQKGVEWGVISSCGSGSCRTGRKRCDRGGKGRKG
uniref:Brain stress early protein n=1 Tax=Mus musculus TaxID=10090 RepID=Q8R4D3_MOUSE|nr:brain stress early protein [Mus musculus]